MRYALFAGALVVVLLAGAGSRVPSAAAATGVTFTQVAGGLSSPLGIVNAGDGSGRLFVLEQPGRVRVIDSVGNLLEDEFLDLTGVVSCCVEQGLLGLAFHPQYETNGLFYVNYTDVFGDTVIARYAASPPSANVAQPAGTTILTFDQPAGNHNGGDLHFGPDGYLYISSGDGGGMDDPNDYGQNEDVLLGKILRIDVDGGTPYAIPPGNPLVGVDGRDEIWATGLRNPWRFSFDRVTSELYIADVGEKAREEVNVQAAGATGLRNYGWRLMEGSICHIPATGCDAGGLTAPSFQYAHGAGDCAVTGGYVYRGAALPALNGMYVYGDFCSGWVRVAKRDHAGAWRDNTITDTPFGISAFGEGEKGELYLASYFDGRVYRLTGTPDSDADGCADVREMSGDRVFGGERSADAFWDFFDVTADRRIDLGDALDVLSFFGSDGTGAANLRDRAAPDQGAPWRTVEANDGVDLSDALALLNSFGHDCN
jgi:glucose/arabinose dehydrogenase